VHIRIHTNCRPFLCPYKEICDKSFKTRSQLSDHLLKHTKIKKYSCPECKISFSRKSRLKIHQMIHKGEMPFQCSICQKRFRERSNLNYHIKKHKNNEITKKKLFKNIKRHKNNRKHLSLKKKMIKDKKVNNIIIDNKNFGICTLINSNNKCDCNNNYFNNRKEETNKLEQLDNIIEMKLNNINHCGNDEFKNYIDFKENLIINLDKSKDLNKESFINTNEYDGKSNISNTENDIDDNDNFIINNNELIDFSDIENYENQISNKQDEETNLKAFPLNLWDTFEVLNRFV